MSEAFNYQFTALRGKQSGREYFVVMCPLKLIPRIFLFDEEELPPELRAQRTLNRSRIPHIANYIVQNPKDYAFSSITVAIDGEIDFQPLDTTELGQDVGRLIVPMTARFLINDGQHRRAAIEEALKNCPELADETISVVFFVDQDLKRSQQLFADLNKHAIKPTKSLGILYDHRDPLADLCRKLINQVDVFKGLTETEKTSISNRSNKLFTLSGVYQATEALLKKTDKSSDVSEEEAKLAAEYWTALGNIIPEWRLAKERRVNTADLRREYIHAHGIVLQSLGVVGASLLAQYPQEWEERLQALSAVDWRRVNTTLWEGRAMNNGRISKSRQNITLTVNSLKSILGLPLTVEEQRLEEIHRQRIMLDDNQEENNNGRD
ncbi:DNA sulfur modification protein DndB [Chloroflexota bacterium]